MSRRRVLAACGLWGALAAACTSETVAMWPPPPVHWQRDGGAVVSSSPMTPTDKERALTDAFTAALASPQFSGLASILDEEAHLSLGASNAHGRERTVSALQEAFGAFDERRFIVDRVWLTDSTRTLDSQAFEWTMTGIQARSWGGVAPTQKPVVIKGVTLIWTNDDGIISDLHVYFDEDRVRAELGSGSADLQKLPLPAVDAGARQVFERGGTPEESANIASARAMLQALEDNKEADFLSCMADDVQVVTLDAAEPSKGKDAPRAYFRSWRRAMQVIDTAIQDAWGVQSFVVLEYAITGLQGGPLPRIAFAAGHPLHTSYVDLVEFRGGKVATIWRYADPASFGPPAFSPAPSATKPDAGRQLDSSR